MKREEFAELAAGHALHALSEKDEARFQRALIANPRWQVQAEEDAQTAAHLVSGTAAVEPPASLRGALLAQIASTPQVPAPPVSRGRGSRIIFVLAACAALVVGIGYSAVVIGDQLIPSTSVVALERVQDADDAAQASAPLADGGTATVHWSQELGAAILVADGLEPLTSAQTYQLWLVRGETPLPAGIFEPHGGEAVVELAAPLLDGDIVAVTIEQTGGSATALPTSDPIVAIATR